METWHNINRHLRATCEILHAYDSAWALMAIHLIQREWQSLLSRQNENEYAHFWRLIALGILAVVEAQGPQTYSFNWMTLLSAIIAGQVGINT